MPLVRVEATPRVSVCLCRRYTPWGTKKEPISFMNKSFNTQCNLTKFSTLIVNECFRRCYFLISGIYTNFRTFLYKKSDYQSSNEIDVYRLVFVVSISFLRKILTHAKIKYTEL